MTPGREIEFAYMAFRVYRDNPKKPKQDERGSFVGWSSKYDEYMPIFSPNIAPAGTHTGNSVPKQIQDDDEDLDNYIQPSYGFERVYAVPRIHTCLSKKFLYLMDSFGNQKGFDILLNVLES